MTRDTGEARWAAVYPQPCGEDTACPTGPSRGRTQEQSEPAGAREVGFVVTRYGDPGLLQEDVASLSGREVRPVRLMTE